MNLTIIFACNYLMRAVCFAGAALLAYHDKSGWGWFIVAGLLTGISTDSKQSNVESSSDDK